MSSTKAATPPTTPPAIAPLFDPPPDDAGGFWLAEEELDGVAPEADATPVAAVNPDDLSSVRSYVPPNDQQGKQSNRSQRTGLRILINCYIIKKSSCALPTAL